MANQRQHRNEGSQAHLPRSGHSLSHKFAFTAACGQLLPTFYDYASPGDKYSIKTDFDLSRALPLLQPASLDIEVCTDYFFIPMTLMYTSFGERFYGTNQVYSSSQNMNIDGLPQGRIVTASLANMVFHNVDYCDSVGKQLYRMFDMFGYLTSIFTPPSFDGIDAGLLGSSANMYWNQATRPQTYSFALWPFLAYQACYQYFYRDEEHEEFMNDDFNLDDINGNSILAFEAFNDEGLTQDRLFNILRLRYVNRRSDYFTDVTRSALLNMTNLAHAGSMLPLDKIKSFLSDNPYSPFIQDKNGDQVVGTNFGSTVGARYENLVDQVSGTGDDSLSTILNTVGLRSLFAQEKLLRLTNSARKNYDDQTLAHFGFSVPHDVKHEITHFGHNVMKYKVSEVVSTAQTDGAPLGEQAGRLYGAKVHDKFSSFTAPCHGVVIAITFVRPDYSYLVPETRLADYRYITDWWRPEYDHIGMQPVFRKEIQFNAYSQNGGFANDVVGWQYRWSELKKRFNRVTHAFAAGSYQPYMIATSPNSHIRQGQIMDNHVVNFNWIANATPLSFKVSPTDTDNIFGAPYNPHWGLTDLQDILPATATQQEVDDLFGQNNVALYNLDVTSEGYIQRAQRVFEQLAVREKPQLVYATDPFQLNAIIHCNKVSYMSDNSLPKLDM